MEYNDIENIFFEKLNEGSKAYKLLVIYTPFDLMMIKSFFISENIPYFVEFGHLMKVYPFVHASNYNNANIYILDEDYNDAIFLIKSYIKSKKLNEYKFQRTLRSAFEYICIGWVVPSPDYFLGFNVNYKELTPTNKA